MPDLPGLRPSGDRGRETLFNWLEPWIRGSRCADLFAGSGALGFEAASRGAKSVVLIEKAAVAVATLRKNLETLIAGDGDRNVQVVEQDALFWLESCEPESLDVVFIDPPFGTGLERRALELLAEKQCLEKGALVYLEMARKAAYSLPGSCWETVKEKALGEVQMRLLKKI